MKKVGIVTDTTACIPQEQVEQYDIEIVPVQLIFENQTYRDGIDISPTEFYGLLRHTKKLPTTSSSSPDLYLDAYRQASQRAESVLCITEPSRFSAMFSAASIARKNAVKSMPGLAIEVIDCSTAAAGQGLVALAAARAAVTNLALAEVKEVAVHIMKRVNLFATLDTLHYLAKGGRVPQAAALLNSLLKIKPIFSLNHAGAHTVALPRTISSAMERILKLMDKNVSKGQPLHVAVMHADALDRAETLKSRIASQFECNELFITEFTPVMGVHTGPGLLGVAFYGED